MSMEDSDKKKYYKYIHVTGMIDFKLGFCRASLQIKSIDLNFFYQIFLYPKKFNFRQFSMNTT